jgi:outer membrane protein assembly factor BamD (BamD/ComL family)
MKYPLRLATILAIVGIMAGCGEKLTEEQQRAKATEYEQQARWEEAADSYEKLIKSYPNSESVDENLYKLAVIYANNLQEFGKSIAAYKRVIEEYPESQYVIQSTFMIGYRYANDLKDMDNAKTAYEQFLAKFPDHELASSVKWELDHLGQDISEIDLQLDENEATAETEQ